MKLGDTGYIRIEGFDPEWRQAVVVNIRSGGQLVLAVRVGKSELSLQSYSSFEIASDNGVFILVEGDTKRMRDQCPFPHRALEVDPRKLLTNAKVLQEEESVNYATASEDLPKKSSSTKLQLDPLEADSGSDSAEESGDSEGGILAMLKRAERSHREKATHSEDPGRRSKHKNRYPLLETRTSSQQAALPGLDELLPKMLSAGSSQQMDLNSLIQLELLRELRGNGKSKKNRSTDEKEDRSASDPDESSSNEGTKLRGAGKALRAYRKSRRHKRQNPLKYVRRYVKEVEEQLGVTDNSAYKLIDFTRRLQWGKFKTLMRFHYALSEVLQELLRGRPNLAALQVTQLLRATHQLCLDNGEWKTAWLLLDLPDPVQQPRFGGEVRDLETVAAYVRAMHDLEKRSKGFNPKPGGEEEEQTGKGKGKRGKKGTAKTDKNEEKVDG